MRVLVVGSGGREHALAWAISASPLVDRLFCAPGNAGIAEEAECIAIGASDIKGLVQFCRGERIDFVVVGPEAPLVLAQTTGMERRQERRDTRQNCRQANGLVGADKRHCKQNARQQ